MITQEDRQWMERALTLARNGYGTTSPNPMVGAVVVKDGLVLGEGWHHQAGQPHAEPLALDDAGNHAQGATLYVTLEPCSTFGRTPPCCDRIIKAGVKRVVIGCMDRNPKYCGAAVAILEKAGIQVTTNVLRSKCEKLNDVFFWWIEKKRPYVTLKMAMTLDGKIATADGESKWITGKEALDYVQYLRRGADAIMVGGNTYVQDKPSLTVRIPENWGRQPRRLVWTSRQSLPPVGNLAAPETAKPQTRMEWLEFLADLGGRNVTSLLLEGGGELAASALKAGIVNKLAFFVAPKILGGRGSRPVVGGANPASLDEALKLKNMKTRRCGNDLLILAETDI